MYRIHMVGVPIGKSFDHNATSELYREIAKVAKVEITDILVYIYNSRCQVLTSLGYIDNAPHVQVYIEWPCKSNEIRQTVVNLITEFLLKHEMHSVIIFTELVARSLYVYGVPA